MPVAARAMTVAPATTVAAVRRLTFMMVPCIENGRQKPPDDVDERPSVPAAVVVATGARAEMRHHLVPTGSANLQVPHGIGKITCSARACLAGPRGPRACRRSCQPTTREIDP